MTSNSKTLLIVALAFFVGGGLAWRHSQRVIHQFRWTVLEEPIRLEHGFSISQTFTVDTAANYWVAVQCRRTIPFEALDYAITKKLAVDVTVSSSTSQTAFGSSSEYIGTGSTKDSLSRYLVTFKATPGVTYTLTLHATGSLPELAATNPIVIICIDHLLFKDAYVTAALSAYFALALAIAGALCTLGFLSGLVFRRFHDNNRNG